MELVEISEMTMTYLTLESLDYGVGGQLYGTLEGSLSGERLSGSLSLTNLAGRRPDNVNMPTLRGLVKTDDGATVWVQMDGLATLREDDGARVFVTSVQFRTGDERYRWLTTVVGALEGVLDSVGVGGRAHGRLFECRPTVT